MALKSCQPIYIDAIDGQAKIKKNKSSWVPYFKNAARSKYFYEPVFSIESPIGTNDAIRKITDQLIDS